MLGGLTSSAAVSLAAGGGTSLADAGTVSTLSGAITGVDAWTKAGPGTLTQTGANTYIGGTTLNGGVLAVNSDFNLGTGSLNFNGGTLEAGPGFTSFKAVDLAVAGGPFWAPGLLAAGRSPAWRMDDPGVGQIPSGQ